MKSPALFLIVAVATGTLPVGRARGAGLEFVGPVGVGANLVVLPDGSWEAYRALKREGGTKLTRVRSTDQGHTWSGPVDLDDLPGDPWGGAVAVYDLARLARGSWWVGLLAGTLVATGLGFTFNAGNAMSAAAAYGAVPIVLWVMDRLRSFSRGTGVYDDVLSATKKLFNSVLPKPQQDQ